MEVLSALYDFPLAEEDADKAKEQQEQVSQIVTGCTLGKGNLIYKDYGKSAFTFHLLPSPGQ